MTSSAKVAIGVQALEVVVDGGGRVIHAFVSRGALEGLGFVGPDQRDMVTAFAEHQRAIEAAILLESNRLGRFDLLLTTGSLGESDSGCPGLRGE